MNHCSRKLLRTLRILLVEDNRVNQMVVRGMLTHAVARLEIADNGAEALAILRSQPDSFDVVLMDLHMPVMDGYGAAEALRAELGLTQPIVAMSAAAMEDERQRCAMAGMTEFLCKPVMLEELYACLHRVASGLPEPAMPAVSACAAAASLQRPFVSTVLQDILVQNPAQIGDLVFTLRLGVGQARWALRQLAAAVAAGDSAGAQKLLHSARSALGTPGAKSFADLTVAMERALRETHSVDAASLSDAQIEFASEAEAWGAATGRRQRGGRDPPLPEITAGAGHQSGGGI